MIRKLTLGLVFVIGLAFVQIAAQEAALNLRLTRDFGYGGLDNRIQGRFSMHASGPDNLVEVRFRIDDAIINVDKEPPFRYQFETNDFDPGQHTMSATGLLADGREIQSQFIVRAFLSDDEANQQLQDFILPLIIVIGGITLLGVVGPLVLGRNKKHRPGVYGMAGGAVCPRCTMPFSRSTLAPNMLVGKLERCPHCGKWSIVPRASADALIAAEERLSGGDKPKGEAFESEEEKRKRLLDESRFNE